MLRSMTGFASATGGLAPHAWNWELRSVNGKGQDLRLRVPDWIDGLEIGLRKMLAAQTARGTITLSLRLTRDENATTLKINHEQLRCVLRAIDQVEAEAAAMGVGLTPSKASDIVAMRGVLEAGSVEDDPAPLTKHLLEEAKTLISAFNDMRRAEGAALEKVLLSQLDEVAQLTSQAKEHAKTRSAEAGDILRRNLRRVLDNIETVDEDRLAQELAMIAVKSDVTEEVDRLAAHVTAARDLIRQGGPVGRKLDFLMQEFNREANTLCAKAQNTELTRCGLALKAVIDQMREQVQNVE
ncbi:YicC family protein [Roseobacter denitrificans]|uniref:YicC-like family, N-terminal domain protein n=1 Tax=Roseobacter denitrificans (strain ATCC 33942 / OCh 114) TaxID=375451 RepID=Q166A8_ROSDO|nr:YicC/YloC family endoribonuclease [Roseobacter denitrificans]ABG32185.1 YicC-like family, N-terminal domain protein [Roseobacter denitrificans OCh 114]AVL51682.1 YicC family protein [Roseobacter denitrificans]SFF78383.1 TIGR00255 family protein [Roseobacter denitrificans OCh 114]